MSGIFDSIPIRSNADDVDASWWNIITNALKQAFPGYSPPVAATPFVILNNQSTYQSIGLTLDKTLFSSYVIRYELYRKTDTPVENIEVGYLTAAYKPVADTWGYSRRSDHGPDVLGLGAGSLHFDATSGEFQYKSSNLAGANHLCQLKYVIVTAIPKAA